MNLAEPGPSGASDRVQISAPLSRQDAVLEACAQAASLLLSAVGWEQGVEAVLRKLGRASAVDRVLLSIRAYDTYAPFACGWSATAHSELPIGEDHARALATALSSDAVPLLAQGPVYGEREDFPAGNRELFKTLNARSLMLLPVLVQGELRGTLAFACAGVHYWTAAERSALSAAGQTIAGVVENERLQDQLKRDERQYRELVEGASDIVLSVDQFGTLTFVNGAILVLLGYEPGALTGRAFDDLVDPDSVKEARRGFAQAAAGERLADLQLTLRGTGGERVFVRMSLNPRFDEQGDFRGASGYIRDVSELKESERRLLEAEGRASAQVQRRAAVFAAAHDAIFTMDVEGTLIELNDAACEMFGIGEEAVGCELASVIAPPQGQEEHRAGLERFRETGEAPILDRVREETAMRSDGTQFPIELSVARIGESEPAMFTGVVRDITQRKEAERKQRLADAAEAANRLESEFMSRMSHELRTPLNAISGFGQLLAMDDLQPQQAEHVGYVIKSASHMLALVDDVLDFSRIKAGQLSVSPEPTALDDTVRDSVALVGTLACDSDVTLHVDGAGLVGDEHVQGDARRLKQVLLNVLSNAIKYNHPGGRVEVSFEVLGSPTARVRILISDTGVGIAPDHFEKLFEPFERLGVEKRAIDGTGLGLTVSKALIEAMGGTITASSTVSVGSAFTIELAVAPGPGAVDRPGIAEQEPQSSEPSGDAPARQTVLYIEDNVSNMRLAERILERLAAVEMIAAMQGSLGLTLARDRRPDLIMLDLQLPDMQGEDVLKRLKADALTRDIPVVVLTADASKGTAERLMRLGASEFVAKPIDVRRFLAVVQLYLDDAERPNSSA